MSQCKFKHPPLQIQSQTPPKTTQASTSVENVVFGTLRSRPFQKPPFFRMSWHVQKIESKISEIFRNYKAKCTFLDPIFLYKIVLKMSKIPLVIPQNFTYF